MKVKKVLIRQHGGPEVLEVVEDEIGEPGPGEVLLRNKAIGLNYIDTYFRTGLYPPPMGVPFTPGGEAAGVVEAVGEGVSDLKVGQRVAHGTGPLGAYAEARIIPAAHLVPIPDEIDDETAAAMMLKGMTTQYLLRQTFRLEAGQTCLIHAAAGGVGSLATQWAKHLGATVIGTAGSKEKADRARALGCDHVILYKDEDFAEQVKAITEGRLCDVVYDGVGKATFMKSLDCLKRRGMMVSYGNASGAVEPISILVLSQKGSLYLTRPTLNAHTATREELLATAGDLIEVVRKGAVKVDVNQRFPLEKAAEAHRALEGRETTGSTVILP